MDSSGSPLNPKSFLSNLSLRHTSWILKQQKLSFVKQKSSVEQSTWSSILLFCHDQKSSNLIISSPGLMKLLSGISFISSSENIIYFFQYSIFFKTKNTISTSNIQFFHDCYFLLLWRLCSNPERFKILKFLFLNFIGVRYRIHSKTHWTSIELIFKGQCPYSASLV